MPSILLLTTLNPVAFHRVVSGYTSNAKYNVAYNEAEGQASFALQLVPLPQPYIKHYDPCDAETLQRYTQVLSSGYSWGAYTGEALVGLLIAEPQWWNRSLWVWEFHVVEAERRRGLGAGLMAAAVEKASREGLRTIVCETQNTNAPAIQVYRKLGFRVEGVDISYYTNADYPEGEVAVFMKRRLG